MKEAIIKAFIIFWEAIANLGYWGQEHHELLVRVIGIGLVAVIATALYKKLCKLVRF